MKNDRNAAVNHSIDWTYREMPISELKFYKKNPRKNTKEQEEKLKRSIEKFGIANPECVNADGTVIGGNFRLKIYKQLGLKTIPCLVANRMLTESEMAELNLRLNKNTADWDFAMLKEFDAMILEEVGFENLSQPIEIIGDEKDFEHQKGDNYYDVVGVNRGYWAIGKIVGAVDLALLNEVQEKLLTLQNNSQIDNTALLETCLRHLLTLEVK